jgi:hypothetical protein
VPVCELSEEFAKLHWLAVSDRAPRHAPTSTSRANSPRANTVRDALATALRTPFALTTHTFRAFTDIDSQNQTNAGPLLPLFLLISLKPAIALKRPSRFTDIISLRLNCLVWYHIMDDSDIAHSWNVGTLERIDTAQLVGNVPTRRQCLPTWTSGAVL